MALGKTVAAVVVIIIVIAVATTVALEFAFPGRSGGTGSTSVLTSVSSETTTTSSASRNTLSTSLDESSSKQSITSTSTTSDTSSTSTRFVSVTASGSSTSANQDGISWPTYHQNLQRDGVDASSGSSQINHPTLKWSSPVLDGAVYAEPLVASGAVIAATENNSVYALSENDGHILWKTNLGPPVPRSNLPCGDIDPTGITGTPTVNILTGTVYAVAFLMPGVHELFALNLTTGNVIFQENVNPPGVSPLVEQQRGALAISNGIIYIPYGGLAGDCGQYHGYVLGVYANQSGPVLSYQVPTGIAGGVWAPSGLSINQNGDVFIATGNSESSSAFDYGNSVIRLSPTLEELDYFAPSNWLSLNQGDTDIGSLAPSIVGNDTLFQIGKEGVGYLLNESNLGGIGGQLFSSHVCSGVFGGTAYNPPFIYVPCINGLYALKLDLSSSPPSFAVAWNALNFNAGPPIVAGGAVWSLDSESGTLFAFAQGSGTQLFQIHVGNVMHFSTPSVGGGLIFVAASDAILSYAIST